MSNHVNRTWLRALEHFDNQDLDRSLYVFEIIPGSSKISFNKGMIQSSLGDYQSAVASLKDAVSRDTASAVDFFQLGVLLFSLEEYPSAIKNFSIALFLMVGRPKINYQSVGLNFCLYACEVLFNCAMCLLHLGKFDEGIETLAEALEKQEHPNQIPSSLEVFSIPALGCEHDEEGGGKRIRAGYWRVFEVPKETLYRPPAASHPPTDHPLTTSKTHHLTIYPPLLPFPSHSSNYHLPSASGPSETSSNRVPAPKKSRSKLRKFSKLTSFLK